MEGPRRLIKLAKGITFTEDAEKGSLTREEELWAVPVPHQVCRVKFTQQPQHMHDNQGTGTNNSPQDPGGNAYEELGTKRHTPFYSCPEVSKLPHDHLASKWQSAGLDPRTVQSPCMHLTTVLCSPQLPEPPAQVSRVRPGEGPQSSVGPGIAGSSPLLRPQRSLSEPQEKSPGPRAQLGGVKVQVSQSPASSPYIFWLSKVQEKPQSLLCGWHNTAQVNVFKTVPHVHTQGSALAFTSMNPHLSLQELP